MLYWCPRNEKQLEIGRLVVIAFAKVLAEDLVLAKGRQCRIST